MSAPPTRQMPHASQWNWRLRASSSKKQQARHAYAPNAAPQDVHARDAGCRVSHSAHTSSRTAGVEAALLRVPGVQEARVCALSGRAEVLYDPGTTGPRHLLDAVAAAGFKAEVLSAQQLGAA